MRKLFLTTFVYSYYWCQVNISLLPHFLELIFIRHCWLLFWMSTCVLVSFVSRWLLLASYLTLYEDHVFVVLYFWCPIRDTYGWHGMLFGADSRVPTNLSVLEHRVPCGFCLAQAGAAWISQSPLLASAAIEMLVLNAGLAWGPQPLDWDQSRFVSISMVRSEELAWRGPTASVPSRGSFPRCWRCGGGRGLEGTGRVGHRLHNIN